MIGKKRQTNHAIPEHRSNHHLPILPQKTTSHWYNWRAESRCRRRFCICTYSTHCHTWPMEGLPWTNWPNRTTSTPKSRCSRCWARTPWLLRRSPLLKYEDEKSVTRNNSCRLLDTLQLANNNNSDASHTMITFQYVLTIQIQTQHSTNYITKMWTMICWYLKICTVIFRNNNTNRYNFAFFILGLKLYRDDYRHHFNFGVPVLRNLNDIVSK